DSSLEHGEKRMNLYLRLSDEVNREYGGNSGEDQLLNPGLLL
ncbi:unnamed protein product, partial [marine sediment metagenome]